MITGKVVKSQAIIDVAIEGTDGASVSIAAIIDTGYNGAVTLPNQIIRSLGLPLMGHRRGRLADGSVVITKTCRGVVRWFGESREVLVAEMTGTPLVGMALLTGCRLTIDAFEGGQITIAKLPRSS